MSNKTPEPEKESTSQTGANSPRGSGRSSLSCPINRGGLGAEEAPRARTRRRGRGERREEGEGRVAAPAAAARSHGPYHRLMFRHINGKTAVLDELLRSLGSDWSTSSLRPLTHTHTES